MKICHIGACPTIAMLDNLLQHNTDININTNTNRNISINTNTTNNRRKEVWSEKKYPFGALRNICGNCFL